MEGCRHSKVKEVEQVVVVVEFSLQVLLGMFLYMAHGSGVRVCAMLDYVFKVDCVWLLRVSLVGVPWWYCNILQWLLNVEC